MGARPGVDQPPSRDYIRDLSAAQQRTPIAAVVASNVIAAQLSDVSVTHTTQALIGQALHSWLGKVPVKLESLMVKLCLAKKSKIPDAPPPGTESLPILPLRKYSLSLWQVVCDNMHFTGKNAREYIMMLWHEYSPAQLNAMGFFDITWPEGSDAPPVDHTPKQYADAILAPPTAAMFHKQFPSAKHLADPTDAAFGALDEAERCRIEEAMRVVGELHKRIGEEDGSFDSFTRDLLACRRTTKEDLDLMAQQINQTPVRDTAVGAVVAPLNVAYHSAGVEVKGTCDTRSFDAPRALASAPTSDKLGVYGLNNCSLMDAVVRKLGSKQDVAAIAYWIQFVAGTGNQVMVCKHFLPHDYPEAPCTGLPDEGEDGAGVREWGRVAKEVLTRGPAVRAIVSSDQSPVNLFNRGVCADSDGENFSGAVFTSGNFHLHKALLGSTGTAQLNTVLSPLIRPYFPSPTNQVFYTKGGDPRPRWEAEPRFALGFTIGLAMIFRQYLLRTTQAALPADLDIHLITWRTVLDHFDAVCRKRPSLFPIRMWLRQCDTASLLRGSGKAPDFDLARELGPVCAQFFAVTNSHVYVRWIVDTRVLLSTCPPWTVLVHRHMGFTKVTSRNNPKPTDEYQEEAVGDGRKVSGSVNKVYHPQMSKTLRPRVAVMDKIVAGRRGLLEVDLTEGEEKISGTYSEDVDGLDIDDDALNRDAAACDAAEEAEDVYLAGGGDATQSHALRGEHLAGIAHALRFGASLVDLETPLKADNGKAIADTTFCSLVNGEPLNPALLAAPTEASERLTRYVTDAFPYFADDDAEEKGEGKVGAADGVRPVNIIGGRIVGKLRRAGETQLFARIPLNEKQRKKLGQHHSIVQTTTNVDTIEVGKSDFGKYFTEPILLQELAAQRNRKDDHQAAVLRIIPEDIATTTTRRSVHDLANILSQIRKEGVPCTDALKEREPPQEVIMTSGPGGTFFKRKGAAFQPFDQRLVANVARDMATGNYTRFDWSIQDPADVAVNAQNGGGGALVNEGGDDEWTGVNMNFG